MTLEIANALSFAAIGEGDAEAEAIADLLEESANDENLFVAEGLSFTDEKSGKQVIFDGYGSLNVPSSRANPAYLKRSSSAGRKRLFKAIQRVKRQSGDNLQFITFTEPNVFGWDFERGDELLTRAMTRLKNHPFWKANFRGGGTSYEFTDGKGDPHFHFHCHVLGYVKSVDSGDLRRVWTSCLKKAALDMDFVLKLPTSDELAVVNIKYVKKKVDNSDEETMLKDAIMEVCKYVVKGSDFTKIPVEYLCSVERTLRGRRLVETFGEANLRKGRVKPETAPERQYVHKNATIQEKPTQVVDSKGNRKPETLRQKGARMIREGKREEWKAEIKRVFAERAQHRKVKLAQKHPYAVFTTLSGEVWRGVAVSDERFYEYLSAVRGDEVYCG